MNFNEEMIRVADGIIDTLNESGFFNENPFIGEAELTQRLKEKMKLKNTETGDFILTDKEFVEVCNEVMHESLTDTMESLLEKGAIRMSIGEDGQIYYSANPDFDINKLTEDDV